jgi:hypothetical protein
VASWGEFAAERPQLAELGRQLLWHEGEQYSFAFLATVSSRGRIRLHPVCPLISTDGRLYVVAGGPTPKKADLRNDGRYALHSLLFPGPGQAQFYVSGTATELEDTSSREPFKNWELAADQAVFELHLERVLHTGPGNIHTTWIVPT